VSILDLPLINAVLNLKCIITVTRQNVNNEKYVKRINHNLNAKNIIAGELNTPVTMKDSINPLSKIVIFVIFLNIKKDLSRLWPSHSVVLESVYWIDPLMKKGCNYFVYTSNCFMSLCPFFSAGFVPENTIFTSALSGTIAKRLSRIVVPNTT